MSKSNLAVKEELENVAAEDVIIINQNEQENYRPSKDKEIRVNNNLSYLIMKKIVDIIAGILGTILLVPLNCGCLVYKKYVYMKMMAHYFLNK